MKHSFFEENQIDFRLVGVCNSKRFASLDGDFPDWQDALANGTTFESIEEVFEHFRLASFEHKIWADNTASAEVAAITQKALSSGISVVCSNKIAATGSMSSWKSILAAQSPNRVMFQNETNVCAALPVLITLRSLIASGDHIRSIEGVLSGSLNFIFSKMDEGLTSLLRFVKPCVWDMQNLMLVSIFQEWMFHVKCSSLLALVEQRWSLKILG
jgi:aspartokinase/homoserine dehydrogenase 1